MILKNFKITELIMQVYNFNMEYISKCLVTIDEKF